MADLVEDKLFVWFILCGVDIFDGICVELYIFASDLFGYFLVLAISYSFPFLLLFFAVEDWFEYSFSVFLCLVEVVLFGELF